MEKKITQKSLNDAVRAKFMALVRESLEQLDEEILVVGSNEFAIPTLDGVENDTFVTIKFSVPTGSRSGDAYDGYALAEEYKAHCDEQAEKKKAMAETKAKKIAQDKARREKLKASKEAHEATTK